MNNMFSLLGINLSIESIINSAKEIINDKEELERFLGNGLSKKENKLLAWCNYLYDNTKFKNISLNHFNNITFESKNRKFKLEINNNYYILIYDSSLGNYYAGEDRIIGNFHTLRNWFKKRNYLKG